MLQDQQNEAAYWFYINMATSVHDCHLLASKIKEINKIKTKTEEIPSEFMVWKQEQTLVQKIIQEKEEVSKDQLRLALTTSLPWLSQAIQSPPREQWKASY